MLVNTSFLFLAEYFHVHYYKTIRVYNLCEISKVIVIITFL